MRTDLRMHIEYDEHIWTSPVNAQAIVKIISRTLSEADPGRKAVLRIIPRHT